jgi:predicted dehydrogenase
MVSSLIKAGKHILCEKPLCFDEDEAEKLVSLAKEHNVVCATNFNVRFHMACQKAKQIVNDENFGRVLLVHGNYLQEFHALPAPMGWRYNETLAGTMRAVTEIGTHWVDIAQYVSGKKIVAVSAQFGCFNTVRHIKDGVMYSDITEGEVVNVVSEDVACVNLKYEDGVIGSVLLSEVSPGHVNQINLEITGEKGNVWWNSEEYNIIHSATKNSGVNTEIFAFGNGFMDTFRELVKHYYAAVEEGSEPDNPIYPTFEEGCEIVKICNAIQRSAMNNSAWEEIK